MQNCGAVLLLFWVVVLTFAPARVEACSCVGGTPLCETFWKTDVVFAGEVVEIAPIPNPDGERFEPHKRVRLKVLEAWRGGAAGTVELATGAGGGDCGYRFEQGVRYLVYAHWRGGVLSTSICSRTRRLADASEDLEYLKTALQPSAAGRIFGTVRYPRDVSGDPPERFIAGYTVTLSNGRRTWKTTSDRDGRFEFTGVAAGEYTVHLSTPGTESPGPPSTVTLADPRGCAAADFYVVPNGRISVRLIDAAGGPRRNVMLELLEADAESARYRSIPMTERTDDDGQAVFEHLRPKRYLVALNSTRPPSVSHPYPPSYYPGVESIADARIIDLAYGEQIDLGEWNLPDPLPSRQVTGQVVWPDGKPAAGAHVSLDAARGGPWTYRGIDEASATTDREGRFTLTVHEGVPYEAYAIFNVGEPVVQWRTRTQSFIGGNAGPLKLELQPPPRR